MGRTHLRARVARVGLLVVTFATLATGLHLLLARTLVLWEEVQDSDYAWEATPIDVTGIGLALLCTGILCTVIVLVCEGYLRQQAKPWVAEPVREDETS